MSDIPEKNTPVQAEAEVGQNSNSTIDITAHLRQKRKPAEAAEPSMWTDDWTAWFVRKWFATLTRAVGDKKLGASDSTLWAGVLYEELTLGWYHDDLYGLRSRSDPLFQPVKTDVERLIQSIANELRNHGVTVEKSVTRVGDVMTAFRYVLPRPNDGDWINWDREHWNRHQAIVFTNGILDLETLVLRPLTADDRATWRIPYRWMGDQPLPPKSIRFWLTHFQNLFGKDKEARPKTQAVLVRSAVALTPWIRGAQWQKALLLIGSGQNGKGTWIRLWMHILGPLLQSVSLSGYDDHNRFGLSNLRPDTLVVVSPDMDENVKLRGTERFKKLTGDDAIDWERKNRDIITTQFQARVWMAGPVVPKVADRSQGMFRRLSDTIIMFDQKQPENAGYEDQMKTTDNIETLLVIAVTALHRVITGQQDMPVPASAGEALQEYRRQIDPWEQWFDPDDGWLELDPNGWVATPRLYQVYQHWYQNWTGKKYPEYMSRTTFGKKFTEHLGPRVGRGTSSTKGYAGVAVKFEWDRMFDEG